MGIDEFVPVSMCVPNAQPASSCILNMYDLCLVKRTVIGNCISDLEPLRYIISTNAFISCVLKLLTIMLLLLKLMLLLV